MLSVVTSSAPPFELWMLVPSDCKGVAGLVVSIIALSLGVWLIRRARKGRKDLVPEYRNSHIEKA